MSLYRILVVDDHPLYRSALRNVVSDAFDDVDVLECEDIKIGRFFDVLYGSQKIKGMYQSWFDLEGT